MPNWCEGTLKVRGPKANIIEFLKGGIKPFPKQVGIFNYEEVQAEIEEGEYSFEIRTPQKDGFIVVGASRNFIETNAIELYFEGDEDELICVIENYKAAWAIDVNALTKLSNEFQVDLKIYAYERGMEFNLDYEVHKGEVVKCNEITFDNYVWECNEPHVGG